LSRTFPLQRVGVLETKQSTEALCYNHVCTWTVSSLKRTKISNSDPPNLSNDKAVEFFCIPAFIWQPTGGGLLNLTKPAQNLYLFGNFKKKIKKFATKCSFNFFHFGKISPKERKH
jgi:hypothetical protein